MINFSKQDYSDDETTPQDHIIPAQPDTIMDFNTDYQQPPKETAMPNRNFVLMGEDNLLQHTHIQVLPDGSVIEDGSLTAEKVAAFQPTKIVTTLVNSNCR